MSANDEAVNAGGASAPEADAGSVDTNPQTADAAGNADSAPSGEGAGGQPASVDPSKAAETPNGQPPLKGLGEDDGSDDADGADKDAAGTLGAPDGDYDFSGAKLPEGFSISEAAIGKFSEVAKELNLSQTAATKLVEEVGPALEQAQRAQIESLGQAWLKEAFSDPDMGGVHWKTTLADANRALNQFCPPNVKQILTATGLNRNPDVIRMFRDIGRAVGSDPIVRGSPRVTRNPLANFYDNSNMN